MIAALALAGLVAAGAPPRDADPGTRIAEAARAAQALQGPLDGRWVLRDGDGRALYALELADPAGGRGPLTGAWRDPRGGEGVIGESRREGRRLRLLIARPGGPSPRLRLVETAPGRWVGRMGAQALRRRVVMTRDQGPATLPKGAPPV